MRYVQLADRLGIAIGIIFEDDDTVSDIVFYRINISVFGIYVDTAVELNVRLRTPDHALRFGARRVRRRVVEPAEHANAPRVGILKIHLIQPCIDGHGAINRIRVEDVAHGRASHLGRLTRILGRRKDRPVFESGKQIPVFRKGHLSRAGADRFPHAHFASIGQLLDGNQLRRAGGGLTSLT